MSGASEIERLVDEGGDHVFLEEELDTVDHGLPHAEWADAAGSPAVLDAADELALEQHGIGHGAEEDCEALRRLSRCLTAETPRRYSRNSGPF